MAKKNDDKVSVLAFEKKLVPSDGYMYGTSWDNRHECVPLTLQEKSVRGTISNRLKAAIENDPLKLNAEVQKPNLQTVDACALKPEHDTLKLSFTLKILGGIHRPTACNHSGFRKTFEQSAQVYANTTGFAELAKRYAKNIAGARFLWRNRMGAEAVEVAVTTGPAASGETWAFNALDYNLREFDTSHSELDAMAASIAEALSSSDGALLMNIDCYAQIGASQEVYPSEELVMDKGNSKSKKSKILYAVDGIAAMHSQKIGNALRTIDTWYPEYSDTQNGVGPIAIEPYGAVTTLGKAFRPPKEKQDFYSFFDKWARGESLENQADEHYVMAVLVRGGVFGQSDR